MGDQLFLEISTKWESRYREWLEKNPAVFDLAKEIAREAVQHRKRLSSGTVVELIRWKAPRTWAKDDRGFKLNQNFGAYLIRDLIRDIPDLRPLVELRGLRSERTE